MNLETNVFYESGRISSIVNLFSKKHRSYNGVSIEIFPCQVTHLKLTENALSCTFCIIMVMERQLNAVLLKLLQKRCVLQMCRISNRDESFYHPSRSSEFRSQTVNIIDKIFRSALNALKSFNHRFKGIHSRCGSGLLPSYSELRVVKMSLSTTQSLGIDKQLCIRNRYHVSRFSACLSSTGNEGKY